MVHFQYVIEALINVVCVCVDQEVDLFCVEWGIERKLYQLWMPVCQRWGPRRLSLTSGHLENKYLWP